MMKNFYRLELIDPLHNHKKFYEVWLEDNPNGKFGTYEVFTKWGRIGTAGQYKNYQHGTIFLALDFIQKKILEKTYNGYKIVTENVTLDANGSQNVLDQMEWIE